MSDPNPHKPARRPRYGGKNPRQFAQKYKELQPDRYVDDVVKVLDAARRPRARIGRSWSARSSDT